METQTDTRPEDVQALHELRREVTGPDDHDYLDDVKEDLHVTLANGLGHNAVEKSGLLEMGDGVVVAREAVEREFAAGHDMSGPYNGGRRA